MLVLWSTRLTYLGIIAGCQSDMSRQSLLHSLRQDKACMYNVMALGCESSFVACCAKNCALVLSSQQPQRNYTCIPQPWSRACSEDAGLFVYRFLIMLLDCKCIIKPHLLECIGHLGNFLPHCSVMSLVRTHGALHTALPYETGHRGTLVRRGSFGSKLPGSPLLMLLTEGSLLLGTRDEIQNKKAPYSVLHRRRR